MITKSAMVVLAGYQDEPKKEKKFSTLKEIAQGTGAVATTVAGDLIKSKKHFDAYKELYPGIFNQAPGERSITWGTLTDAYKTLNDSYDKLKNDNTRMGKLNYFIANKLSNKPYARIHRDVDSMNDHFKNSETLQEVNDSHLKDLAEVYSILKNPKLNALGHGMYQALPLYMTYKIAKILYGLGKGALGSNKKKIFNKNNQFAGAGATLTD
jgi:hypothetical protein